MEARGYSLRAWTARVLIAAVTFMNLQAALQCLLRPRAYAWGFELSGVPGEAMIQGLGLLFLMWSVPYLFAVVDPQKHFLSLVTAVIMQFIGFAGESLLLMGLEEGHPLIVSSVTRFIIFDGAGLVALLLALWLVVFDRKASIKKA